MDILVVGNVTQQSATLVSSLMKQKLNPYPPFVEYIGYEKYGLQKVLGSHWVFRRSRFSALN